LTTIYHFTGYLNVIMNGLLEVAGKESILPT